MREIIRFAWGSSPLGDFMVAVSGKGLVAVEFGSHRVAVEDALRVRFPECDLTSRQDELTDILKTVTRAIEEPGFDPAIPLDLRGTPYEVRVWAMLRAIPVGETTNYGASQPDSARGTPGKSPRRLPAIPSQSLCRVIASSRRMARSPVTVGGSSASASCSCANSALNGGNSCDGHRRKTVIAASAFGTNRTLGRATSSGPRPEVERTYGVPATLEPDR
jgi:hypothetical protein